MSKLPFTSNWFAPNEELWLKHVAPRFEHTKNVSFLELGSYEGRSALWILEHVLKDPSSSITCVDCWNVEFTCMASWGNVDYEAVFDSNTKDNPQVIKLKGKTDDVLPTLKGQVFDGAYIDSEHTYQRVLSEAHQVWPLLVPGAVLVFDDHDDPNFPGVPKALREFRSDPKIHCETLYEGRQLMLIKTLG